MGKSYMGPDDGFEEYFKRYPKDVEQGTYDEMRRIIKEEKQKQMEEQAQRLAELGDKLDSMAKEDGDDFEIGGAL